MSLKGGFYIEAYVGDSSVPFDTSDLAQAQADLALFALEYPKAAVRAVNAAMKGTVTDMKTIMRASYMFKAGDISKRIRISRAKIHATKGFIESKGRGINLTDVTGTRQTKKGVSVKSKRSGTAIIPSAFIQTMKSGKQVVLRRPTILGGIRYPRYGKEGTGGLVTAKGKKKLKARLEWFETMRPEFLYNTKDNWKILGVAIKERVDENIKRETDSELRKLAGKWG